ncbi:MAG TPA: hypothetical protein VJ723_06435 [Candidatus Angelobacter sp.]|nr:hypothetical protein [Candidatus Angelobacter sp.]
MRRTGEEGQFLRGGAYDYKNYLKVRRQYGWSPWLAYWIAPLFIVGLLMTLVGFALVEPQIAKWKFFGP